MPSFYFVVFITLLHILEVVVGATETRGWVMAAFGEMWLLEAEAAAVSIRMRSPQYANITMFTDAHGAAFLDERRHSLGHPPKARFDSVYVLDMRRESERLFKFKNGTEAAFVAELDTPRRAFNFIPKVFALLLSPYERTIFVDSDVIVCSADVARVFDLPSDVAVTQAPMVTTDPMLDVSPGLSVMEPNTGVIFARRTTMAQRFLQLWLRYVLERYVDHHHDQGAFRHAAYTLLRSAAPFSYRYLPQTFNCRIHGSYMQGISCGEPQATTLESGRAMRCAVIHSHYAREHGATAPLFRCQHLEHFKPKELGAAFHRACCVQRRSVPGLCETHDGETYILRARVGGIAQ